MGDYISTIFAIPWYVDQPQLTYIFVFHVLYKHIQYSETSLHGIVDTPAIWQDICLLFTTL